MESPAAVMRAFAHGVLTRDLEGLIALYEPDALFVPEPQVHLTGHDPLRKAFTDLFAIHPMLELTTSEVLEASQLAFVTNAWTLRGTAPDGSPIERSGRSAVLLRRDGERGFRIVIDRLGADLR
jgi:ketosteroid isomerase-like protein